MECIRKTMIHTVFTENVRWHIVGEWPHSKAINELKHRFEGKIFTYGYQPREFVVGLMPKMHLSFVPSVFLEAFWLVALESLSQKVPVCGFKKWGLIPFITDDLALQDSNTAESFLKILGNIMENGFQPLPNLELFSLSLWREELKILVKNTDRILIVHDYLTKIWGAEAYISILKWELMALGKQVEIIGYAWYASHFMRKVLAVIAPFAFWHWFSMKKTISTFQPDLIWMHGVARYIGPFGLMAITGSDRKMIMTHHDLGLITARPSRITSAAHIPNLLAYKTFIIGTKNPLEMIARTGKYFYLQFLWVFLRKIQLHLVPSEFMKKPVEDFGAIQVEVFSHSIR